MFWDAFDVEFILVFAASVALHFAFKVVVSAFAALPTAWSEIRIFRYFRVPWFFIGASVALLSSFEVAVVALRTLPATVCHNLLLLELVLIGLHLLLQEEHGVGWSELTCVYF